MEALSAQQIKLNIHTLVNGIEDESVLDACYEVLARLVKIAKKPQNGTSPKEETLSFVTENGKESTTPILAEIKDNILDDGIEKVIPHDLSLVLLANEMFKGSGPIP
jgi:hypothetical protein